LRGAHADARYVPGEHGIEIGGDWYDVIAIDAGRVLVVVGDGSDTNLETAKPRLRQLAKQAAELHIEVHAIVYKTPLSSPETVISTLDPNATTVTSTDAITGELAAVFAGLGKHR